jgi:hypothetical protein
VSLWLWLLVAALLASAARSAVDIALDRVRQEPWRRVGARAVVMGVIALLWLVLSPKQAPVAITGLLAAAGAGGRAWLLRDLPAPTLPPVKY